MSHALPDLVVETREIDPVDDLLPYASADDPLVWVRRGDGVVGVGRAIAVTLSFSRSDGEETRGARAAAAWRELAARAVTDDPVDLPGTGLVGFGTLPFDDDSRAAATISVPRTIIGRHRGRAWVTRIRRRGDAEAGISPEPAPYGPPWSGTLGPGAQTAQGYQDSVTRALGAITAGDVEKIVVARDLAGIVPAHADLRRLVRTLASGYPDTWTFAVDGLMGASPETLVTVHRGTVTARVLAGTATRGADADADQTASLALATSAKDQDEHGYAVRSVVAALRPHTSALAVGEQPFMLKLPNVWHLATDVEGSVSDGASSLDLVGALHPTAAVAGAPTADAIELIRLLEPFDRGRYAGPVGWIDGTGDGEWAIALRCAQFDLTHTGDGIPLTAYAGAGVVSGSDPEAELWETRVKFRPIVDALA